MLRHSQDLLDLSIVAVDGNANRTMGDVKDLYFDDQSWTIRYLVVDTGAWLSSRKVLISPIAAGKPDWAEKHLPVSLTHEQVKNSPLIDTDQPVTRQHETDQLDYYSFPYYWSGIGGSTGVWGGGAYPHLLLPGYEGFGSLTASRAEADAAQARADERAQHHNPHLRSCQAIRAYHLKALDGEIGQVKGLLVDEESWTIRYVVASTGHWWLGHDVLVAPQWIKSVEWGDQTVVVDVGQDALKKAPPYDGSQALSREMEVAVFQHYGRAGYWSMAPSAGG